MHRQETQMQTMRQEVPPYGDTLHYNSNYYNYKQRGTIPNNSEQLNVSGKPYAMLDTNDHNN